MRNMVTCFDSRLPNVITPRGVLGSDSPFAMLGGLRTWIWTNQETWKGGKMSKKERTPRRHVLKRRHDHVGHHAHA